MATWWRSCCLTGLLGWILSACVIPVAQEAPFQPEITLPVEIGKSSRDDVLFALGVPQIVNERQNLFGYTGTQLHAYLIIGGYYHAEAVPIFTVHNFIVGFDESGKVDQVARVTGAMEGYCLTDNKCFDIRGQDGQVSLRTMRKRWKQVVSERAESRQRDRETLLPKARRGEVDAQFAMAKVAEKPLERWHWLCLSAHGGHARAQHWMAARSLAGTPTGSPNDKVGAYMWYTLAARNGDATAALPRDQLRKDMTGAQIERARDRISGWAPDPASCGPVRTTS